MQLAADGGQGARKDMGESIHEMEAKLEALEERRTGLSATVKSLTSNGKRVEYRDMSDIDLAIARLERKIRIAKGQMLRQPWRSTRIHQGWF